MLGVSTYAYAWRRHADNERPWTLTDVLDDAVRLGVGLVQVCDVAELEEADDAWLAATRRAALERGLALETGTKGVEPEHLRKHLHHATALGATLVRSMLSSPRATPTVAEAASSLEEVIGEFEAAGVTLALETYEQFPTEELVGVVEAVASPNLGICLDPGNSVARLELPRDTVARCAPHVVNLHVKDFAFSRSEGMIGFSFAGAPLGTGLLEYDWMVDQLRANGRDVNHVVEHWLPRQATLAETCALEQEWVDDSVAWLRERS